MDALNHLFTLADAYAAHTGLAEATVSRCVLKNGNRLRDLRAKKTDIGIYRIETALHWFDEHWPTGLEWPPSVPRPVPSEAKDLTTSVEAPEAA